ncbi:aminoglycoside phosphotransferase family protein [Paenibacillus flagellatus]|uniref:Phosphotransferase n=1 Tax=Paenibacillus flagellatus TaxID=2211139 RepID=A0A2V5K2A4_9BACL|nr:aminoglycoside phosphotransferase family protein [Paenibacillus flagellatus]PYI51904.1 phosphotransferase [Paenibacillus flagellatus]
MDNDNERNASSRPGNIHADEVAVDESTAKKLVATQFPQWAQLPVRKVESDGTDNAIYRLGEELAVRFPRIGSAVGQVEQDFRWLPFLAPQLPLPIPAPVAKGEPGEGYPWVWSVFRWLEGECATTGQIGDSREGANVLARFVAALHRIDPAVGTPPVSPRGMSLLSRDRAVRDAIAALDRVIDTVAATAAWEAALRAPEWRGPPVWIHGDLHAGNVLVDRGRVSAVIDFGCFGAGDPACDMLPAWSILDADGREAFRATLMPDEATWARGRGWALSIGLIALPYYMDTHPGMARIARRLIDEVLSDRLRD